MPLLRRLLGWFLLAVPLVPVRSLFGDAPGLQGLVPPREWLLGLFVFGAPAWLVVRLAPRAPATLELAARRAIGSGKALEGLVTALLCAALLAVSWGAFGHRPLLVDSVVQLFQARIFAAGLLTAPAPPLEAFFATQHMIVEGGRWYSQYPPGHSALLALGVLAGAPWLVPVALSTGTALLLSAFARRAYGPSEARLTLLLVLLSPFFWFLGASHMNHVTALFFVSLALFLVSRWEHGTGGALLLPAGLALGGAFLTRPLDAVAAGAVLAILVVRAAAARGRLASLAWAAAGLAIPVGGFLLYNLATTGDPVTPGYLRLWGASHGLGFHATPWGDAHTALAGLRNELVDLSLLAAFLFETPLPGLIPAGVLFAAGWSGHRWDGRLLAAFLAVPAAYLFYWHRDAFLGPRYLYGGLAFLIPLTSRSIVELYRRLRGSQLRPARVLGEVPATGLLTAVLSLCFLYTLLYAAPRRFLVYRSGLASMKVDLRLRAAEAGIRDAIVFVPVSWGNRLIARARGLGAEASVVEAAYRRADHCEMEGLLRRAEAERWAAARVTEVLRTLPAGGQRLGPTSPNGDPTLRLTVGGLTPLCADQLAYDQRGYSNFTPHLADNDPLLDGDVVIARDLRDRNAELGAVWPGRALYLWRRDRFEPLADRPRD